MDQDLISENKKVPISCGILKLGEGGRNLFDLNDCWPNSYTQRAEPNQ